MTKVGIALELEFVSFFGLRSDCIGIGAHPRGSGTRWSIVGEHNRRNCKNRPIMTSGGGSDANIVAERRARSARVRWRVGGVIRGHRRSSCAVWRELNRLSPGYRSCIADCRTDYPTALKVLRSLTRRFRVHFQAHMGRWVAVNAMMWRYGGPTQCLCYTWSKNNRIDALRRVQGPDLETIGLNMFSSNTIQVILPVLFQYLLRI